MEKSKEKLICPVVLDLGAEFTGVYYAKYAKGALLSEIQKKGEVLTYDNQNYTILLKDRTAKRHQRRVYDRLQFAKRLLVLVLENYFKFTTKGHLQALSFFLNRRGFTYIEPSFSKEYLDQMPQEAWDELPKEIHEELNREGIATQIDKLFNEKPEKIGKMYDLVKKKVSEIKRGLVYYDFLAELKNMCGMGREDILKEGEQKKKGKNQKSKWLFEEVLKDYNVEPLKNSLQRKEAKGFNIDIIEYLAGESEENKKLILNGIPSENDIKEKKKDLKNSVWNFNIDSFGVEEEKNKDNLENKDVKTHLNHFCFALNQINQELGSGARHRKKFFEEIESDLKGMTDHTHTYLQNLSRSIQDHKDLTKDKLYQLIGHISNFELKPLRAYFNDESHKGGDQWSLESLSKIASRWFLKNWRVSEEKDNRQKVEDYHELRKKWKEHSNKNDVVDFWFKTNPKLTIPPYQSLTNRRPPKCQSLVLNGTYLDKHYPNWRGWLEELKSHKKEQTQAYIEGLKSISSQKNKRLLSEEQLRLRELQYILDASQKKDPFRLNELWSIHHEHQQKKRSNQEQDLLKLKRKLSEGIQNSKLPEKIKKSLQFSEPGSFGHFLNRYYKARKRARAGRYFLHQEKKEKWMDAHKLLRICSHKPRQKRHQMGWDLANVFQIKNEDLKGIMGGLDEDKIEGWLKDIKGLPTHCKKSSELQKKHKGELKRKLGDAEDREKKKKANKDDKGLLKVSEKSEELAQQLAKRLWPEINEQKQEKKAQAFKSIFSFAQIQNIVFEDRSGFSSTCPVCSVDNNRRMQKSDEAGPANASRLPALSIRLIDGAVMRYCSTAARHIARTSWEFGVEEALKSKRKVVVPLILEQNRFEFEPELKKLKSKKPEIIEDDRHDRYEEKKERIKQAAGGICAYSGKGLNNYEIDHIIPRASEYGTLNDEANLICVDKNANQAKGKKAYTLANLHPKYKQAIFQTGNDEEITAFIKQKLLKKTPPGGEDNSEEFVFGRYFNLTELNDDQQKAFRHALFLEPKENLRGMVIDAIDHRKKTMVNGTQRYMAQCIADELWRKAKKINHEGLISFDYFEFPSRGDISNGVFGLRKAYEENKEKILGSEESITDYAKAPKEPQKNYSHFLDAQMAFLLAADSHRGEGSMGVTFSEDENIWDKTNSHDESSAHRLSCFKASNISPKDVASVKLKRNAITESSFAHRSFHRDNFYAQRYLPLWVGKDENQGEEIILRAGFSWENSVVMNKKKTAPLIFSALGFARNPQIAALVELPDASDESLERLYQSLSVLRKKPAQNYYIVWDRQKIHGYYMEKFSTRHIADGAEKDELIEFFQDELAYRTERKKIENPEVIEDVLKSEGNFIVKKKIILPARSEWERLKKSWEASGKLEKEFLAFLKEFFKAGKEQKSRHRKVRKVFSLPVCTGQGHYLQRRLSWSGEPIYQIASDPDSRKDGNKFAKLVFSEGELKETIHKPFVSRDTFKLEVKKDKLVFQNYIKINPNQWIEITDQELPAGQELPKGVKQLEYRLPDVTRPKIRLTLARDYAFREHSKGILEHGLIKTKDKKEKEKLTQELEQALPGKCTDEYTGGGFTKDIKKILSQMLSEMP